MYDVAIIFVNANYDYITFLTTLKYMNLDTNWPKLNRNVKNCEGNYTDETII